MGDTAAGDPPDGKRISVPAYRRVGEGVDAMVLSGCRLCSNLPNEDIQLKGGTHRLYSRTKERKEAESKVNPPGS